MTTLPEVKKITIDETGAYAIFTNGAVIGYREHDEHEFGSFLEVAYMPGDFKDTLFESNRIEVSDGDVEKLLLESLSFYYEYKNNDDAEQLVKDWSITEVLLK